MEHVLNLSHDMSILAVQLFAQTSAVIIVGLLVCLVVNNRTPLLQNLLCRWTLVAILIAPAAMLIIQHLPTPRYSLILPLDTAILEQTAPVAVESPNTAVAPDQLSVSENSRVYEYSYAPLDLTAQPEAAPELRYSTIETSDPPLSLIVRYGWILYLAITLVWGMLTTLGIIRLINSFRKLLFIIRSSILAEPELCQMVAAHSRLIGTAVPRVLRSPFAHSPFLTGLGKSIIIVPDYLVVTDDIILHELIHLKRHDIIWSFMGQIIFILFPVQPLVRVLVGIMEETNDLICDRFVVEQLQNPKKYAMRLVSLTALLSPGNPNSLGLGLLPSRRSLKFRIKCILEFDPKRIAPFRKHVLSAFVAGIIVCSLLSGYIEVRGEKAPSLFTSFVFTNSMKYIPGAKRIVQTAQNIIERVVGDNPESPDPPAQRSISSSFPEIAEIDPLPEYGFVRDSGINMLDTAQRVAATEAIGQTSADNEEELKASSLFTAPIELTVATSEEYIADFDVLAELADHGIAVSSAAGAMPAGDVGIPGAPRIITEFSTAKPVNVACDYDMSELTPSSTKEEIAELEYLRSLDKNKQEVVWSPDGVTLAFTDNNRIWIVSADGGEPVLVYEYKQNGYLVGAISDLCFTPDGKEIIFTKNIYDPTQGSSIIITERYGYSSLVTFANPIPNIERVNLETGEHKVLIEGGSLGTVSRDGSCMFYVHFDPDVYRGTPDEFHNLPMILDFETGRKMVLTTNKQKYGRPTFSPDDTYMVLTCYNPLYPEQLLRMNVSGGDPAPITSYEMWASNGRNLNSPSFDPTGRWILYTDATWHVDGPDKNLWVYSTVTGKQYPLFENSQYDQMGASWNNDGTNFCFIRKTGDTNYLYVMDFITPEAEKKIVRDIDKPLAFELKQNYPNPFNIETTIGFSIPEAGDVTFMLYSITGQKVRTLVDGRIEAGRHKVVWDGHDDFGGEAASGTYLSLITYNGSSRRGKMTLLK